MGVSSEEVPNLKSQIPTTAHRYESRLVIVFSSLLLVFPLWELGVGISELAKIGYFQVGQIGFFHGADDHLARLDINAPHPLAALDHDALGDAVDATTVEIDHASRAQG